MASSCELNCRGIDASVGGLVWVRRRNGSWWPGRILGQEELSEMSLLSPKSGTPVKLLGREDASMDWYNLETSKRVKAFRCGEYDGCIEKAKVYATRANRKGVKYARREEAILQALELECARYGCQEYRLNVGNSAYTDIKYGNLARELHKQSGVGIEEMCVAGKAKGNSMQKSSLSVKFFEQPNHASATEGHNMQKRRRKTPNDSEDDGTEGTKRMKGLQDLGLRVASKRKHNVLSYEGSLDLVLPDSASLTESNICNSLSTHSPVHSSKGSCSSLKRRCSQAPRKDRRRPLTKVMESTAKMANPAICDWGAYKGHSSLDGVVEVKVESLKKAGFPMSVSNHSDSPGTSCEKEASFDASELTCNVAVGASNSISHQGKKDNTISGVLESPDDDCSDAILNVPFVEEENITGGLPLAPGSGMLQSDKVGKQAGHSNVPLNSEEFDETGSTSFASHLCHTEQGMDKHTSKWQLKGKWNSKFANKSSCKSPDSRSSDQSEHIDGSSAGFGSKFDSSFESLVSDNCNQSVKYGQISEDPGEGIHHQNQVSGTRAQPVEWLENSGGHDLASREVVVQSAEIRKTCKSFPYERQRPVVGKSVNQARSMDSSINKSMRFRPMLPQNSYTRSQSCLAAHFSGEAVAAAAAANARTLEDSLLYDVNLNVQASYHGHHVPLVSLMSRLNGKAIIGRPITVEVTEDGYSDHLIGGIGSGGASSSDDLYDVQIENASEQLKNTINAPLPVNRGGKITVSLQKHTGYADFLISNGRKKKPRHSKGRSPLSRKKASKKSKKSGFSKKTLKLSSLTHDREPKLDRKPVMEKLGSHVISCVPLKLVFSRIYEGLNGCSARPTNHLVR